MVRNTSSNSCSAICSRAVSASSVGEGWTAVRFGACRRDRGALQESLGAVQPSSTGGSSSTLSPAGGGSAAGARRAAGAFQLDARPVCGLGLGWGAAGVTLAAAAGGGTAGRGGRISTCSCRRHAVGSAATGRAGSGVSGAGRFGRANTPEDRSWPGAGGGAAPERSWTTSPAPLAAATCCRPDSIPLDGRVSMSGDDAESGAAAMPPSLPVSDHPPVRVDRGPGSSSRGGVTPPRVAPGATGRPSVAGLAADVGTDRPVPDFDAVYVGAAARASPGGGVGPAPPRDRLERYRPCTAAEESNRVTVRLGTSPRPSPAAPRSIRGPRTRVRGAPMPGSLVGPAWVRGVGRADGAVAGRDGVVEVGVAAAPAGGPVGWAPVTGADSRASPDRVSARAAEVRAPTRRSVAEPSAGCTIIDLKPLARDVRPGQVEDRGLAGDEVRPERGE